MEEIIGILVLVAALIFKVVGKKFNDAGGSEQEPLRPEDMRKHIFAEVMEEVMEEENPVDNMRPAKIPEPVKRVQVVKAEKPKKLAKAEKKEEKIIEEEKPSREKIDPKKLIIYSEIMNRKY